MSYSREVMEKAENGLWSVISYFRKLSQTVSHYIWWCYSSNLSRAQTSCHLPTTVFLYISTFHLHQLHLQLILLLRWRWFMWYEFLCCSWFISKFKQADLIFLLLFCSCRGESFSTWQTRQSKCIYTWKEMHYAVISVI